MSSTMFLNSKRLKVRNAFSLRNGGVSEGPYRSLNLGGAVGDDPAKVAENARLFARALELTPSQLVSANQVHGDVILDVEAAAPGDAIPKFVGDADGLVTNSKGTGLCIRTADCVPVLIHAPDVGAIAAVHAGWKGTDLRIAAKAVKRLQERFGAKPEYVVAAIGPSIRKCCYEVSEDLADRFRKGFGKGVVEERAGEKPHLDIAEANRIALRDAGVRDENIETLPECTACDAERFFSHRRDGGKTGRHVSVIWL